MFTAIAVFSICPVLVLDFLKIRAKLYQTNSIVRLIQFVREKDMKCLQPWQMLPGKQV